MHCSQLQILRRQAKKLNKRKLQSRTNQILFKFWILKSYCQRKMRRQKGQDRQRCVTDTGWTISDWMNEMCVCAVCLCDTWWWWWSPAIYSCFPLSHTTHNVFYTLPKMVFWMPQVLRDCVPVSVLGVGGWLLLLLLRMTILLFCAATFKMCFLCVCSCAWKSRLANERERDANGRKSEKRKEEEEEEERQVKQGTF